MTAVLQMFNAIKDVTGPLTLIAFIVAALVFAFIQFLKHPRGLDLIYEAARSKTTKAKFSEHWESATNKVFVGFLVVTCLLFLAYIASLVAETTKAGQPTANPPVIKPDDGSVTGASSHDNLPPNVIIRTAPEVPPSNQGPAPDQPRTSEHQPPRDVPASNEGRATDDEPPKSTEDSETVGSDEPTSQSEDDLPFVPLGEVSPPKEMRSIGRIIEDIGRREGTSPTNPEPLEAEWVDKVTKIAREVLERREIREADIKVRRDGRGITIEMKFKWNVQDAPPVDGSLSVTLEDDKTPAKIVATNDDGYLKKFGSEIADNLKTARLRGEL